MPTPVASQPGRKSSGSGRTRPLCTHRPVCCQSARCLSSWGAVAHPMDRIDRRSQRILDRQTSTLDGAFRPKSPTRPSIPRRLAMNSPSLPRHHESMAEDLFFPQARADRDVARSGWMGFIGLGGHIKISKTDTAAEIEGGGIQRIVKGQKQTIVVPFALSKRK